MLLRTAEPAPSAGRARPALPDRSAQAVPTHAEPGRHPRWRASPRHREALRAELDRLLAAQVNLDPAPSGLPGDRGELARPALPGRAPPRPTRRSRSACWTSASANWPHAAQVPRHRLGPEPDLPPLYEEEYGQLGGEPFGVLVGDYEFDHHPQDVQLLADMARIAAAAHAPVHRRRRPSVMQMDSWRELANPRDLTRIFRHPGIRRLALHAHRRGHPLRRPVHAPLPRPAALRRAHRPAGRLRLRGGRRRRARVTYLWVNAAFAFAANVARAFACTAGAPASAASTAAASSRAWSCTASPPPTAPPTCKCVTEVALSERREAELSRSGFIPLLHRKNTDFAAFVSAQSLQQPPAYDDPAATANAVLSARLPYLFACCRFAHYLKCMVRDKIGSTMSRAQLSELAGRVADGLRRRRARQLVRRSGRRRTRCRRRA